MSSTERKHLLDDSSINSAKSDEIEVQEEPLIYQGDNRALIWAATKFRDFKKGFSLKMALMLLGLVIVGTSNRVAFKIMTNSTELRYNPESNKFPSKYSNFINQVTSFIYIPVFGTICLYFVLFTKRITPEMHSFPKWKFLIMGAFDSLAGILMVFGGSGTAGPLQQLLIQGAIPWTMLISFLMGLGFVVRCFGKTISVRYRWTHFAGAGLIIIGIVVALLPNFLPQFNRGGSGGSTVPIFAILFGLAAIPTAMSNVYKEIAFKGEVDMDIYWVNFWVSFFQFFLGFPMLLLTVTVEKNPLAALKDLPFDFWYGMQCFVGKGPDGEMCVYRLVMVHILVYLVINIFYNILVVAIIKYGSASLLQVSSAMLLPMANIVFTIKPIMNEFPARRPQDFLPAPSPPKPAPPVVQTPPPPPDAAPVPVNPPPTVPPGDFNNYASKLTGFDIGGLVLILVGLVFYRILSEAPAEEEEKTTTHDKKEYQSLKTVDEDQTNGV